MLWLVVVLVAVHLLSSSLLAAAAPPPPPPTIPDNPGEQIAGPAHPENATNVAAWRASLTAWRTRMLAKIDYNGSIYDVSRSCAVPVALGSSLTLRLRRLRALRWHVATRYQSCSGHRLRTYSRKCTRTTDSSSTAETIPCTSGWTMSMRGTVVWTAS